MSEPGSTDRIESASFEDEGESQLELWPGLQPHAYAFRLPRRWFVHFLLFLFTFLTTTVFGFALVQSFRADRSLDVDWVFDGYVRLFHGNLSIFSGLVFSIPLLLILLAHEFGHYVECERYRINASLPYFLPSPTLFGTLGAFIIIRSPIYKRKSLFDIGVSGPLAGFVVLLPFLIAGMWMSRVVHGVHTHAPVVFGAPLLLRITEWVRFPGIPRSEILLHPMAMAAWGGLLATAINLLPIGQLDGGHILYAVLGPKWHRALSNAFVLVLVLLGFLYWPWWIWAVLMFFFGRRHPLVHDDQPLDKRRVIVSFIALFLFLLSISVVPVNTN